MTSLVSSTSLDLVIVQGNSRGIVFTVEAGGVAFDLSNVEDIQWSFFASLEKNTPLGTKTLGSGVTVTDAAEGEFTVDVDPTDTEDVQPALYYHEAVIIDAGSEVYTVVDSTDSPGKFLLRKAGKVVS